jgi:hypothetical protein
VGEVQVKGASPQDAATAVARNRRYAKGGFMTRNVINRLSGIACIGSAILAVLALVGFLVVVGSDPIATAAGKAAFYVPTVAALASTALLGLGLVGLYLRQEERLGTLGVVGFVTALLGTIVAAGASWTYVFVVPHFAPVTPELINESTGAVLAGFVLSYLVLAIGWALFGVATARAGRAQEADLLGFGLGLNALSWSRHRQGQSVASAA